MYVAFAEDGPDGLRARGWLDTSEGKGVVFGSGGEGWEVVNIETIEGK
jgi:acetylcholinesterase